jgi:hyperosmotically inducible periplasmic protein
MSKTLRASQPWPRLLLGATLLAGLMLVGCNNRDESSSAGERMDAAADKAADTVDAAGARIEQSADAAKDTMNQAVDAASTAVADTGITVAIKAQLADDKDLHILNIGVATTSGRALLTGSAPDAAARDRATQIAAAVDGVTSVDNQLTLAN